MIVRIFPFILRPRLAQGTVALDVGHSKPSAVRRKADRAGIPASWDETDDSAVSGTLTAARRAGLLSQAHDGETIIGPIGHVERVPVFAKRQGIGPAAERQ